MYPKGQKVVVVNTRENQYKMLGQILVVIDTEICDVTYKNTRYYCQFFSAEDKTCSSKVHGPGMGTYPIDWVLPLEDPDEEKTVEKEKEVVE